ncbi:hypothetical protein vseg_003804 [Gypsophila vaccaria]
MSDKTFSKLSDDVVLKILFLLEDDPRSWARLSCVSKKFASLVSAVCCKSKCISTLPSLATDLVSFSASSCAAGAWSSLYKIAVCCPGLLHSGVLLDHSDFGLLRELGPDEDYHNNTTTTNNCPIISSHNNLRPDPREDEGQARGSNDTWTMYDDLYFDTVYDNSETASAAAADAVSELTAALVDDIPSSGAVIVAMDADESSLSSSADDDSSAAGEEVGGEAKKRKMAVLGTAPSSSSSRLLRSHLASGGWNLSREEGNKLLASRFREDCLYISDWPGCVHMEERRNYMVFRGVFRNFKRSRVWRTINDGHRGKVDLKCAFCGCQNTWDLHSAFCLKRGFGFHDDGEPVVRAYVCENGHVSGAWTDLPFYTT